MSRFLLPKDLSEQVRAALAEDCGSGDVTSQLIPPETTVTAHVLSRQFAVIAGVDWFNEVFMQLGDQVQIDWYVEDSNIVFENTIICRLEGNARALLTGERTALNFLQSLSGTATQTYFFAEAIRETKAKVLDTRKTIPGLRTAQKYAVKCGGGTNHRMGLYDAYLIKENHISAVGSIRAALQKAQALNAKNIPIEIEVERLDQIEEALAAGATRLLLDNFDIPMLKAAVTLVNGRATLEASGNIDLQNVKEVAETGVDFLSVGILTKEIRAIDFSLRIQE
ncbi:carboxylating nicotinate-nucleotide diphosphorylase [Thioflexithrix psekupsensis]|uniref:Probable nicotinate-nucleotide pyrophosphorylase [carboxylating] n=1 Tax=Thioflexithrix psekupsensis TaxID=1570016 RepID=A0A251X7P9_9GAMM|nr:carboxylating nicotinate-nucleotide diphosphorylase [Thioflexithrix psekupsensis]OUD14079.1 nicotinate-nucleotide diphosphorylase (carboxylating) [Thioflexithrix psekupsensis]